MCRASSGKNRMTLCGAGCEAIAPCKRTGVRHPGPFFEGRLPARTKACMPNPGAPERRLYLGKWPFFFKLVLGGRRGFPTCGPERSAAAPGGHAGRGKESAAKAAVRRMACRSVCISFNTGYIIEDDVSGRASQNNIKEDDVSCSLSVICPEPTRMCHKVTHKNLIDSSPLFRNSQIKI